MSRVLITGSADGLGHAAAATLLGEGHDVVVHVRGEARRDAVDDLVARGADVVVGDLADPQATRAIADQVARIGRPDVVIHNAGVYTGAAILPVNVVAPYLLTALVEGPSRLVYLSSGLHRGGRARMDGLDWSGATATASYSDSKLLVTALALAVARRRSDVLVHAVDPGWVPTRMGGPGAPDDLRLGYPTQEWLVTSDARDVRTTGGYWYHQARQDPEPAARDVDFQDEVLATLERETGVPLRG